jgi:hypothetical protein
MKRALILFLLLATVASVQAAQIKVFLGPTISSYTGRWPSEIFPNPMGRPSGLNPFLNGRTGTLEGFGIEFPISKRFSLEIDGLYLTMGSIFTEPTLFFAVQREIYDIESLNAPILVKFRPRQGPFPYLLAGVDFGFILANARTSLILPEADVIYQEIAREDLMLATQKFEIEPVLGIGLEISVLKQSVFAEVRYRLGLMNMIQGFPGSGAAARIRSLCFCVGYQMRSDGKQRANLAGGK